MPDSTGKASVMNGTVTVVSNLSAPTAVLSSPAETPPEKPGRPVITQRSGREARMPRLPLRVTYSAREHLARTVAVGEVA